VLAPGDIPVEKDLLWAVGDLIQMEEHLWNILGDCELRAEIPPHVSEEACRLIDEIRALRAPLMKKVVAARSFETWCLMKHAISAVYRLGETVSKLAGEGRIDEAREAARAMRKALEIFARAQILSAEIEAALKRRRGCRRKTFK